MKKNSYTTVPERFLKSYTIPREKLEHAVASALEKLENGLAKWDMGFVNFSDVPGKYKEVPNNNWIHGMNTGIYWLAYELSGNPVFREMAEKQLPTYQYRLDQKIGFGDHDVGFVYTPSCVAAYRLFGDEAIKEMLLEAVDYYYHTGYSQKGGYIMRGWEWEARYGRTDGCRTMMDTLMNASLLFWAGEITGKKEYTEAAISQNRITAELLIREDGSSFHHYQFDPETQEPQYGLTFQGHTDDSCWSRGHAWGVCGFSIAYSYVKEPFLKDVHKDVTYYMLNHLPQDLIPYWDYDFVDGDQPRDSSAGAISVCGMLEMARLLPEDAPEKVIYESAAAQMLEALIDHCASDPGYEYDGLICHVTGALPQGRNIDGCAVYGDYFYLEALLRMMKPDWEKYW